MSLRNHCLKRSNKDMQFLPINYLVLLNSGSISFGLRFFVKHVHYCRLDEVFRYPANRGYISAV